ncbi:HAMP domain-containing histidine kinase [Parabacteroides distasonis]|nr:HAMP domain-containing histidine kinase [Parabacteroides distasonis]
MTNACKFTNSGYIKLGFKHLRGTDEVAIFVEDSGIGLSEEQQEKVFSRFFKQDEFSQGAGLGLSICQGIVQNLGGRIELSSKLGKGSRFSVVLPVYKGGIVEREADVLPTLDGILILFLFLLDFCGFTSLGYNDDNSIASFRPPYGSV